MRALVINLQWGGLPRHPLTVVLEHLLDTIIPCIVILVYCIVCIGQFAKAYAVLIFFLLVVLLLSPCGCVSANRYGPPFVASNYMNIVRPVVRVVNVTKTFPIHKN